MTAARAAAAAALASVLLVNGGCAAGSSSGTLPAQTAGAFVKAPRGVTLAYGTYAWSISDVMQRWKAGTLWGLLAAKHVNVILAGFDDAYIEKCSHAQGAAEMNSMIQESRKHGVRVELLLGDPTWILPSGIASLESILHDVRRVQFSALDLDLEPNQVKGVSTVTAFKDLVAAMRAYVAASPWPVSIDVNHIYIDSAAVRRYGYCLMCELQSAGLKRANLMIYISDPKTVAAESKSILASYPSISFTISQSVEDPSVLPKWDSYWDDGFAVFYGDMQKLDASMKPHANYAGITIESLYYLERIKP
jgi:hypothetical protein